ncbi:MAG: hypothetical protein L0J77_02590 [Marinobacter sp.]|nr:hypothetical protein [Marinobacter sp.]
MINRVLTVWLCVLGLMIGVPAAAQEGKEYEDHILSDGKFTNEELAVVILRAKDDLTSLLEKAVAEVKVEMEETGLFSPQAWMLMKNQDLKKVSLSGQAESAPPNIKVHMFRASLRSVARHNRIDAALIVYPGSIKKDGETQRIVAVEHEHRLGVSGLKLIPLDLEDGEASFGEPISQKKPFAFFYEGKPEKQSGDKLKKVTE